MAILLRPVLGFSGPMMSKADGSSSKRRSTSLLPSSEDGYAFGKWLQSRLAMTKGLPGPGGLLAELADFAGWQY